MENKIEEERVMKSTYPVAILFLLDAAEYSFTQFSFNDFMTWYGIPYHFANVSKQLIRLRNVLHAEAVVIKVIIDNSRVGLEGFGNVRQQSGATEQVNKQCSIRILLQHFHEFLGEHALLPDKWERG